jgi:hypothetical protein
MSRCKLWMKRGLSMAEGFVHTVRREEGWGQHHRGRGRRPPSEAGDGARTHDPQLGKLMLYQLSYAREASILAVFEMPFGSVEGTALAFVVGLASGRSWVARYRVGLSAL